VRNGAFKGRTILPEFLGFLPFAGPNNSKANSEEHVDSYHSAAEYATAITSIRSIISYTHKVQVAGMIRIHAARFKGTVSF
jgi:hypothetical protein